MFSVWNFKRWRYIRKAVLSVLIAMNVILVPFILTSVRRGNRYQNQIINYIKYSMSHVENTYTILSFTKDSWISELNKNLNMKKCKYNNCQVFEDQYLLGSSHAVIFHGPGLQKEPPLKSPGHIWIFLTLESPMHHTTDFMLPAWNDRFNWTMTYRRDSDIYFPYSEIDLSDRITGRNFTSVLKKKTKLIALASSHCSTPSKREDYVRHLQTYIPVDVYGKCGSRDCGPWEKQLECYQKLDKEYRFYLSFENSLCTDYITEKVFLTYKTDLIPIIRGGKKSSKSLPHGTYIDASNFQTIRQLADFIIKLSSSEENMAKYLKLKEQYYVKDKQWTYQRALCNICEKLNTGKNKHQVYNRVDQWIWGNGLCFYPKDIVP